MNAVEEEPLHKRAFVSLRPAVEVLASVDVAGSGHGVTSGFQETKDSRRRREGISGGKWGRLGEHALGKLGNRQPLNNGDEEYDQLLRVTLGHQALGLARLDEPGQALVELLNKTRKNLSGFGRGILVDQRLDQDQHVFGVDDQALEHAVGDQSQTLPGARVVAGCIVERCQRAGHGTFDYGREHVFFAGEVVVDQALTDAGLGGDLGDFGGLESLESEHLESSVQDLVTALVSDFLVGQACSW